MRSAIKFLLLLAVLIPTITHAQLAPTPPMGWNSWDAYAMSIDEKDFKANVAVLAGMKDLGWQYAVIDEGWYLEDPFGADTEKQKFVYDANGRLIPALNRFPSAANKVGLKPLADWVHSQGLKFGIHLIRGVPRASVTSNKPIANSKFTAGEAADTTDVCPWNQDNYGIKDNAAGQAWYDSMIGLYASWGVDYLKVDCISNRPYKITEIEQIAAAIKKSGRPIVLSLSPGPTGLENAQEIAQYSQLWRISDDHWDVWSNPVKPGAKPGESGAFPSGTLQAFSLLTSWHQYTHPGAWPDADMLPLGSLTPHPGSGEPRESRLTHDEARTEFTLWAISRSPLILGANLTKLDDFTKSLLTNKAVLDMNQHATSSHPIISLPPEYRKVRVWLASEGDRTDAKHYVAVFNLDDQPIHFHSKLEDLSSQLKNAKLNDLWTNQDTATQGELDITLPPHASALYLAK
jgi:alpha-galactosidase